MVAHAHTCRFNLRRLLCVCALLLTACARTPTTIFTNADILTMNEAAPTAEALAIKGERIIAVGDLEQVKALAGKNAIVRDLHGKTILPGLIDAHGHFGAGSVVTSFADLSAPPAGPVRNLGDLVDALKSWRAAHPRAPMIIGWGYDDSLLTERRHPTRDDLDKISAKVPILLLHTSLHLVSCNTPCLKAAGITADTPDPAGGVIRRWPGSHEPNGVLEEKAIMPAMALIPKPSLRQFAKAVKANQMRYASYGITTAQDGAASPEVIKGLKALAMLGQLKIDVVAYPLVSAPGGFDKTLPYSHDYKKHFRIGGIKLVLDGSPQGKTAWLTKPYYVVPKDMDENYKGYASMKTRDVDQIIRQAFAQNVQLLAHANGDAAADQMLTAIAQANTLEGPADRRPVMIHAQTVRPDQIALMKTENVIPSYFVTHTFYWGDWHRDSVFGPRRAARISPLKSTLDMGVPFTLHNDSPVVPPNMMMLVWSAVNRTTRSGKTLGPEERITPMDALRAITINAAYQYFEEDNKGSLEVGKRADITILSANPTKVPPEEIKEIHVLETIKDGKTIFASHG